MVTNLNLCSTNGARVDTPRPIRKKEKSKKAITLVEVSWIDSYTEAGWSEYNPEKVETKTYGILVKKTREWVTLAMTREKNYWGNLWYIPTKNVVSIRSIETIE